MSKFRRISVKEAELMLNDGKPVLLFDIRDLHSYALSHHPRAMHLSSNNLRSLLKTTDKQMPIVIYCYHGNSSQDMAQLFADFGFEHCFSVNGGFDSWRPLLNPPQKPLSEALHSWLLARGFNPSNVDARGFNSETALMRAAREASTDVVRELLDTGASLDLKNADGNTAIWLACFGGSVEILNLLIAAGADIDNQNDNGATALIYAASASKTALVKALIDAGASASLKTLDDFSPLDVAANREILMFLRKHVRTTSQQTAVVALA